MDFETIKKTYERLPDSRLIFIAQHEASQLMPEAQQLLIAEIKKRNLDPNLLDAVDKQVSPIDEKEFETYLNLIRHLPCPYCSIPSSLTAAVVESGNMQVLKVGCPTCLIKTLDSSSDTAAALGIFGIFRAAKKISKNDDMKISVSKGETEQLFDQFVRNHIGAIELRKNNGMELVDYLKRVNNPAF